MTLLKEKESQLRKSLQEEMEKTLEERGESLKVAQEETARLEIRLRQGNCIMRAKRLCYVKSCHIISRHEILRVMK